MRLYDERDQRLYINAAERERYLAVANRQTLELRAFCLTLLYTGCRLSEGLALTTESVDTHSRLISFRTLKKRHLHVIREVPMPAALADVLTELIDHRLEQSPDGSNIMLWQFENRPVNRITGYRWIKNVMEEAGIHGAQACPKGLRHGYGVHAIRSSVPINMLRRWLGHSSIATTAIYANALGREEQEIAGRMWA